MKTERFGKTFSGYKKIREAFFDKAQNDAIVERLVKADELYRQQPRRTVCKLCAAALEELAFVRNHVGYYICGNCGHLNGAYQDTKAYNYALYADDGSELATNSSYDDKDRERYDFRVNQIYRPKADWLYESLSEVGESVETLSCADMGTGAGHMVKALIDCGFKKSVGFDVFQANLDIGNHAIGTNVLFKSEFDSANELVGEVSADVICAIFMLEHIADPLAWLKALKRNPQAKFALISVPMFSPTVIMEMVFPHVMHRSLGLAHTHLFTRKSVSWIFEECGLEILAEWWFGADAFDLHRNIHMHLKHNLDSPNLASLWDGMIEESLDDLQLSLDRQYASSEVHLIVKL